MKFFKRSTKVDHGVAIESKTDSVEVSEPSSVVSFRDRVSFSNTNRPQTKREIKKEKKAIAKQFEQRKAERTSRIQALLDQRQAHKLEYTA